MALCDARACAYPRAIGTDASGDKALQDSSAGKALDHPLGIGFLLLSVGLAWRSEAATAFAPFGLTQLQGELLTLTGQLGHLAEPPSQAQLAALTNTSHGTISRVAGELEAHGLVEKEPDRIDRRVHRLRATARGARVAASLQAALDLIEEDLLPGDDAAALLRLLGLLKLPESAGSTADGSRHPGATTDQFL